MSPTHSDDEVGLERYVFVLAAWWREITLGAFLIAAMGGAVGLALTVALPKYESSADVITIWANTKTSFREESSVVDQEDISSRVDYQALRAALIGLIHSGKVAETVVERFSGLPEWGQFSAYDLLESISAKPVTTGFSSPQNQSDLIRITASAASPEHAAALANTWAEEYVTKTNQLYALSPNREALTTIRPEIEKAMEIYKNAQEEFEKFLAKEETYKLTHQITLNDRRIDEMMQINYKISDTMKFKKAKAQLDFMERTYDTRLRLEELVRNALGLRAQIERGGEGGVASNGLAIQLLKAQAYATMDRLPEDLEISFNNTLATHTNSMEQGVDVDAIISALRERIEVIDLAIAEQAEALSPQLLNIGETTLEEEDLLRLIAKKEEENQLLRVRMETDRATKNELTKTRDLAQTAVNALQIEEAESRLRGSVSPLSTLRLVSPAVVREKSSRPSPIFFAMVSGVTALPIEMFLVFLADSLGILPFFSRRR